MAGHILWAVTEFLRALSKRAPLLWIVDDLQWGDVLSIGLIAGVLRALADHPLMVLALGRPETKRTFARLQQWPTLKEWHLGGIKRSASERMVRFVLGDQVAASTVARIVQQAEGNPLLIEELIRSEGGSEPGSPPQTVLATLQAQLQLLGTLPHVMLGRASIFGERFWPSGLQALVEPGTTERVDAALQILSNAEFISPLMHSTRKDEVEYSFRHALMREAAYGLVGEAQKRRWHQRAAEYLLRSGEPEALVVAEHFSRSHRPCSAARYFARAGEQLLEGNDLDGARACINRGLSCQRQSDGAQELDRAVRGELLSIQATVQYRSLALVDALQSGTDALDLLPQGGQRWCQTFHPLFSTALMLGLPDSLQVLAGRFLAQEPSVEANVAYMESAGILLGAYCLAGQRAASRLLLGRLGATTRSASHDDSIFETWLWSGQQQLLRLLEGAPWRALTAAQKATAAVARTANRRWIGLLETNAAATELELGIASGEARLRAAVQLLGEMEGESSHGYALSWLSLHLSRQAHHAQEAMQLAEKVLAGYAEIVLFTGIAHLALAGAHYGVGALTRAEAAARSALRLLRATPPLLLGAHAQLIQILRASGRLVHARDAASDAMASLEDLDGVGWMDLAVWLSLIELELAEGAKDSAREHLRIALSTLDARAEQIPDVSARQLYRENVHENARLVALSREYLGDTRA